MATNLLGSAFVRIVPVMDAAWRRMGEQIAAPVRAAANEAARLDEAFSDAQRAAVRAAGGVEGIGNAARQAGKDAGRLSGQLTEAGREGEKAAERTEGGWKTAFGKISGGAGVAFGAAGAAAAAAFGVGLAGAMEREAGTNRLQASLGISDADAARLGKVAGSLYADAYGESLSDVNEAITSVVRNVEGMGTASSTALRAFTAQALSVADVMGSDVAEVSRAVATIMANDLAPNAEAALDVIARGTQLGGDRAGDLLDSFTEYSPLFAQLGLDAQTSMGLMVQGLRAGARDTDFLSDALKEFVLLAEGLPDTAAHGFAALGLNAQEMQAKIAAGGASASQAFGLTLERLRGVKDPAEQSAIAVELFGTKSEDLQATLHALDPTTAVAALGQVGGAATQLDEDLNKGVKVALTTVKRTIETALWEAAGVAVPPLASLATTVSSKIGPAFDTGKLGVSAFFAAFRDGDVTSDGFVGGMERAGVVARSLGETASRAWQLVLPGLRDLGSFVTQSVWPALQNLWAVARGLWPDVQRIGQIVGAVLLVAFRALAAVLANVIGPALAAMTGFWRSNQTTITALAVAIGAGVVAWYAYRGAVTAVTTAQWIWQTRTLLMQAIMRSVQGGMLALRGATMAMNSAFLANPIGIIIVALVALAAGIAYAWTHSETFRNVVLTVWSAVKNAFTVTIGAIVGFVQQWWPYLVGLLGGPIGLLIVTVIKHWDSIKGAFSAATSWLIGFVQQWWPYLLGLVTGPIGLAVGLTIRYWDEIKSAFGAALGWIRDQIVIPVMNGIKGGIDTALGAIKTAFQTTVTAIGTVWDGLKKAAGTPVNFVIGTVYNNGIRKAFNLVAGLIGVDKLAEAPMLQLARGGRLPGYGGGDRIPALLEAGETVVPKHLTSLFAPMFARAGIPGFARGGLVGDLWNATGGKALGAVGDVVGEIAGAVVGFVRGNLAAGLSAALSPVKGLIRSTLGEGDDWKGWLGKTGIKPMDGLVEWVRGKDEAAVADVGPVGAGVQRWAGVASAVLREVGQPLSWLPLLLKRMNQESGGSQFAINRWDINAKNGVPSQGLMQVIPPTFNAYAGPYRSRGIYDPYANIYAAVQYSLSRYGNLGKAWNRAGGYDQGGPLHPGWTLAYNGTGHDEWVSVNKPSSGVLVAAGAIQQSIDARGAADPNAVEAAVERANAAMLRELTTLLQQGEGAA